MIKKTILFGSVLIIFANMIETFVNRNKVYHAVLRDYLLTDPVKPTVMGEPMYEGITRPDAIAYAILQYK